MRIRTLPTALAGAALLLSGGAVLAQIEGGSRGAAPVDSGSAYEVSGVTVDVAGKTADEREPSASPTAEPALVPAE